jgi:single-strand DNA-binding protein
MSNSLNKVQLIGNLTADPEVKETPNGQKVASFSIATNRTWKDQSGQKQEEVEFHNIVAWGKLADIIEQYVKKGKKVYVEGRLKTRNWEDQAGIKKYKTEIIAESLIMLSTSGGRDDGESSSYSQEAAPVAAAPRARKSQPKGEEEISIEDIPF